MKYLSAFHMTLFWCFQLSDFLHLNLHQFIDQSYWDHSCWDRGAWKAMWYSWCGLPRARSDCTYTKANTQACLRAMDVCVVILLEKLFSKSHQTSKHPALPFPGSSYCWVPLFNFPTVWLCWLSPHCLKMWDNSSRAWAENGTLDH